MNIADACIIAIVIAGAVLAWRRSAIVQACGFVGAVIGVVLAGIFYEKLAFLAESSWIRTVVLIAVLAGSTFLAADIFVVLARLLELKKLRRFRTTRANNIVSSGVTGVGVLAMLFIFTAAFSDVLPRVVQEQVKSSAIMSTLTSSVPLPDAIGNLASLRQPFSEPQVFSGKEVTFDRDISILSGAYNELDAATEKTKASMVRVTAWGCGSVAAGSGFVIDNHHVMTNAHVVAGSEKISLGSGPKALVGALVWFDPRLDVAILRTQSPLEGAPLMLNAGTVNPGAIASHLGYSDSPDVLVSDLVVLEKINATGYDIFRRGQVMREIYALRGEVIPGNSGGPVIDVDGKVIGIIVGHSSTQNRTGYAIAANQVVDLIKKTPALVDSVSAGECIAS